MLLFDNILNLCNERGISIAKLEKDTGLGNATIRGWRYSQPRIDNVQTVADYFGKTVDELLFDGRKD